MSMKTCPKCQAELNGRGALKQHMTDAHGGYTKDDLGPSETGNMAKDILGSSSLEELRGNAPSDDSRESATADTNGKGKQGRPKKNAEELAAQEKRKKAMQSIGKVLCRKVASTPYAFWASLVKNDSLRLNPQEQQELTDAYLEICQGYDADFTSPFFGVMAALAINAECIATRLNLDLSANTESYEQ
jgi:hypothetical protein